MKRSAFVLGLVTSSVFAATPQQFYRAGDEMNLIEMNSQMDTETREKFGEDADEIGITSFDFTLSRGVNDNIAVGISTGNKTQGHGGGMKDIRLFVEGQYGKYFYAFDLGLSADIELDDNDHPQNAKSGGLNTIYTLGYTPVENLGIRLDYTPGFTSVVQPKTADYIETDVGDRIWFKGFYEHHLGNTIIGGAFGGLKIAPNKKESGIDERYNTCELYFTYKWLESLDVTGGLNYWFGDLDKYFRLARQGADLGIRYKF